jgi:hypothetical protein
MSSFSFAACLVGFSILMSLALDTFASVQNGELGKLCFVVKLYVKQKVFEQNEFILHVFS